MIYATVKRAIKAKHANNLVDIIALSALVLSIGFVVLCAVVYIMARA